MKKHLALVLALVMVLTSFSFVSAAPDFSDMEGHANAEAVARLELLNVLKGYPDGSFKPDNTITRAEFAAVAVRVSGLENVASASQGLPTGFTDVPAWHWASGYVGTAAKSGIVNGIGNGLFAPETPVKYEEAITMIVRALGYEPMAQARGGYPFGYLIVANEIDLLDGAMGTQGAWATRGFVAQITDNALEIPMMIQVGFGQDAKFVISGSKEHGDDAEKVYLLDRMGFDTVEGWVRDYNTSRDTITVETEDGTEVLDVAEGFDFYNVHGVTVKAWVAGDMVIVYTLKDEVKFDAIEDGEELTLVYEDEEYEFADKVVEAVYPDADSLDADFAKVVLNDDGDVRWVEGFNFDNFIVVDLVDDYIVVDMEESEVDMEDYLIVKDGKTISIEDLEEGDVVWYYADDYRNYDGFAVVFNNSVEGVVTRAYTESFRLDGTTYDLSKKFVAMFIDGNTMDEVTPEVLDAYLDGENEVIVYLDTYGDAVLIVGDRGEGTTTTFGALLIEEAVVNAGRGTSKFINWDMVNELGEEVSYDEKSTEALNNPVADMHSVVEYAIDEDGDLDSVTILTPAAVKVDKTLETDARYAEGYRLQNSTVVFLMDGDDVDEVFTWADADDYFGEATKFTVYADGADVSYLVVFESDAGGEFDDYEAVLVKQVKLANGEYEVTFNIEGTTAVFDVKTALTTTGGIYTVWVTDDYKDLDETVYLGAKAQGLEIENVLARARTFDVVDGDKHEVDRNGVIFQEDGTSNGQAKFKVITMTQLSNLDLSKFTVDVFFDGDSDYYVKYLVLRNVVAN